MTRDALVRRLRYLRNGEFFNVVFLPSILALSLAVTGAPTYGLYAYAMALLCFILFQGGLYWHLKLRIVTGQAAAMPGWFVRQYTRFRRTNLVLLGLYPLLAVVAVIAGVSRGQEPLWATLLAAFAGLEHINYYQVQLMYDNGRDLQWLINHKQLRKAHLAEDLATAKRTVATANRHDSS